MKKILFKTLAVGMAFLFIIPQSFAGTNFTVNQIDEAIVNFDENEIFSSFNEVSALVSYISNNNLSYSEVKALDSSLIENVSPTASVAFEQGEPIYPLIYGPFWWGCFFTVFGVLLVAFVTNNNSKKIEMAVWGCAVSTIVTSVVTIFFYALSLSYSY